MSTAAIDTFTIQKPSPPEARAPVFFCGTSLVLASVVFVGFAPTYFLAGIFHARPLPAPIVHVHAAAFTGWIVLLVIQSSLAASGRIALHRRLGIFGLVLAPCIVILGVLVANEMLKRTWNAPPSFDGKAIYAVALSQVLGFAVPVALALGLRRKPAFHKRFILIGTIAMMTAAFGRWPLHFLLHKPLPAMLATFSLLLMLIAYDLLSMRRVHLSTALGAAWVVLVELTAVMIGDSAAWQSFATQMHSLLV